ncbi:MAG: hypothetical protein H0W10_01205 [Chloroflexi bacterium]|nr:hypothetical protein [Chloroflexota bacterium]
MPADGRDAKVAAAEVELNVRRRGERAFIVENILGLAAAADAHAIRPAADERAGHAAHDEAGSQCGDHGQRGPRGDDRQPDDDENDGPEAPKLSGGVAVDGTGLYRQRNGSGADEGHAPEDEPAVDLHSGKLLLGARTIAQGIFAPQR